ncbi:MAG: DNA-directed RNA polymerase, subunit RPC10 (contains C4-type Zn-finger) [Candidatus Hecatellales archaeon B24]|jgi:DNA-directed RNA polymerase subunit P|nr:MAG: DNA-directed RNA polymerase, subunit RPC10 (contains C4-type Zn-finger) [Candidatus Hecatellales archaeon B24]
MASTGKGEISYKCVRCGKTVSYESIVGMPEFKCPHCGYRILQKVRPPIVKQIKAR